MSARGPTRRPASAPRRRPTAPPGIAARRVALDILCRVEERGAFADLLLGSRLPALAPRDRALVTRLVLGTLAWRGALDHELERLCARPLATLAPPLLAILRMGLFQLRHLSRVPVHAAVDTAVALARTSPDTAAGAGMVNAVLRRAAREAILPPAREPDEAGYLAVTLSHPRWIVEKFIGWFGPDGARTVMEADNEAAPNAVRLNLARAGRDEIIQRMRAEHFDFAPGGRLPETAILRGAPPQDSAAFRAGLFTFQSEASQLVAHILAPAPGAAVLDCCAAPGGKTAHLAELVGPRGAVVALDRNRTGLLRARALAERLGHRNVALMRADLLAAPPLRPKSFDFILLDAPCTGLGTLREHPEIRWRLRQGDLARSAAAQARMLENTAALLRPGGALVYSVCSFAPEEGRQVVRAFLPRHPDFVLESADEACAAVRGSVDEDGAMLTRPDRGSLDGFYAARLRRR